jgi:hypothetical protein
LQKSATNWPLADEIDVCNGNLVVAITKIIAEKQYPDRKSSNFVDTIIWAKPEQTRSLFIWLIIRLFQPKRYFSLTTNQPTVFFNRLISPTERRLDL